MDAVVSLIPMNGIAGSCGKFIFNLTRKKTVFQTGDTILYHNKQCMGVSPHCC